MRGLSDHEISPWVRRYTPQIRAGAKVLDVACGNGRHSRYLAKAGFAVTAVDIDLSRVDSSADNECIQFHQHDLEDGSWPFRQRSFGGVIVSNYLFRPLLPALADALTVNGVLIYDTFATGNERFGKPKNPDYLLQPAELLSYCKDRLRVIAYDHGQVDIPRPSIRQRLCAIRMN